MHSNAELADAEATGTIIDNDDPTNDHATTANYATTANDATATTATTCLARSDRFLW